MKIPALLFVGAVSALTLSACGSSSYTTGAQQGTTSSGTTSAHGLHVASTSLGRVVVDAQGRTVYMLSADSTNHATCDASCQHYWPPTAAGKAKGVTTKVASTALPGGGSTETVGGWPVYTYSGDQKAGDVNGEGVNEFGGTWYAVSPSGTPITHAGTASSSSSAPAYPGRGY